MPGAADVTPVQVASAVVGDAWSILILREVVLLGTRRFVELRESLQVNRATLTSRLGALVGAGLLARTPVAEGSERAVYMPTDASDQYVVVLLSMLEWGRRWETRASDGQLLVVRHEPCQSTLSTAMTCAVCGGPINARAVNAARPAADLQRPTSKSKMRIPRLDQLERGHACPIARCLASIGDRWNVLIIQEAFFGVSRFDAFIRRLGIAPNILSHRLNRLCERGILERRAGPGSTTRPEYRLTDKGLDLYPVPATLRQWAMRSLGVADPLRFTHRWCGNELAITLRCLHCGEPVHAHAVRACWPPDRP